MSILVTAAARVEPARHLFADDGLFPNSKLPVLVYKAALAKPGAPGFEQMFEEHGWSSSWRNGLFGVHHYHSTAHEVLGIYQGRVDVRLGGEKGTLVTLHAGDVVVIPAGVAHRNEGQSKDFRVVGAYPRGTDMDMNYGEPRERPRADRRIAALARPAQDPVFGEGGPLIALWQI